MSTRNKTRVYAPRNQNKCSVHGCAAKYYGATFCKKHHQWHWTRGLLPKPNFMSIADKLSRYAKKIPTTGCIEWQGCRDSHGYGIVSLPKRVQDRAHRVAYTQLIGRIPRGMEVCHRCDNTSCFNIEHLFLGTHADNMRDSANKGRAKQPTPHKGLKHPRAVLSKNDVKAIREWSGPVTRIAKIIGVSNPTAYRCKNRLSYQDIP